ncbi:ERBB receptor feedback inhibitor 1 [Austrofundulus limnaeus]|uniref:ERBB receptor feedback inhibitor 1-like n=1 Tax=Austrofundulus limnaeus TaxID=52670 RepID=A0A2I4ANQ1_AUSLI|nr:PREDICTED: ERBB receptor feedback inhibitor 1-like [Austrofundulus limnaeus]XP_013857132.1 PREDICTED: ERBB receptor feedback inhibitor 1-like [Austrofundulus limnaeus]
MDGNQNNFWGQQNINRFCFNSSADIEHNLREQQRTAKEFNPNIPFSLFPFYTDSYRLTSDNAALPSEGDQVVPSSQKRKAFGGHQKEAKPLPPLPDPEEFMSDEAADNEVEFFTSDRQSLLPKSCPKAICAGSSKHCGQVNYAYRESSAWDVGSGIGSMAFSWPSREDRSMSSGGRFGANNPKFPHFAPQKENNQHVVSAVFGSQEPEQHKSSRIQFSCPGFPAQAHTSSTTRSTEKPQIPPRVPIPPKPSACLKSASEEEKPPKIPPRVPLVPPCPPRTPSPKSLPIYINGVMPVTQSFAANPNYVSRASQRPRSERAPTPTQSSPRIVPILKDGKQASATHYILLPPGRPAQTERRERLRSEPNGTGSTGAWLKR